MLEALALNEADVPEIKDDLDNCKLLKDNQYLNKLKDIMGLDKKGAGNKVINRSNVTNTNTGNI